MPRRINQMSLSGALLVLSIAGSAPAAALPAQIPGGGKVVVANRASGTITVISARTDEVLATVEMPDGGEPMYVHYSARHRRVFVGDRANDRVVAFDARTFEVAGVADAGAGVFHMWGSAGLGQLWVNNDVDNTTSVIDTGSLETLATIPTPADLVAAGGKPHDVIVGPQGEFAYVSVIGVEGPMDYVVQYDTSTFEEVGRAAVGDDPHVSLTPQTGFLYVPCQGADAVFVLDRWSMELVELIDVPGAHGAGMPTGGRHFYTTNISGGGVDAIFTIDTTTLEVVGMPTDSAYPVPHNLVLTPNGRKLYLTHSGGASDKVTVYRTVGRDRLPQPIGEVTVGANPFGLDYVP